MRPLARTNIVWSVVGCGPRQTPSSVLGSVGVVVLCLWALVSHLSICWTTRAALPNGRGMVRSLLLRTSSLGVWGELFVEIRELRDAAAA